MRLHIPLLLFLCCLLGCEKNASFTKNPTFNITNVSSGIIKQVDVKLECNGERLDAIAISDLDINKKETKVIKLAGYNLKGDAGYRAMVTLSDGKKLEKWFGYVTNGVDVTTNPYNIEISNSEILLK